MGAYEFQSCAADLDGDGLVGYTDIHVVLLAWGNMDDPADLDGDGFVGVGDLMIVLATWGSLSLATALTDCR